MKKIECRAKNPAACRYHGREGYRRATENLEAWEKRLGSSESFEQTEEVKQYVSRYALMRDATEAGFKKLNKEYRKTMMRGTDEERAKVATRLRQATELRKVDDGQDAQAKWGEIGNSYEKLAAYAIEQSSKGSVAKMPIGYTGTHTIVGAGTFLKNAGYEITDIEGGHTGNSDSGMLPEGTIKKAVLENLGKHSSDEVTRFAIDNNFYVQGLTFKNKEGNEVKLQGSWELSHDLNYGNIDSVLHIPRKTDEDYAAARKKARNSS